MVFIFYGGYANVFTETYGWGKPRSMSGQMYWKGVVRTRSRNSTETEAECRLLLSYLLLLLLLLLNVY